MSESTSAPIQTSQTGITPSANPPTRLMSIDALRGFDMFWIIGADALVYALHRMANGGQNPVGDEMPSTFTGILAYELEHAKWAGFHFYDLIFPLFVFIVGVSLVFSLTKQIEKGGRRDAMKRIFQRSVLMFIVALLYSGGFTNPWPDMRLMGVLNRIALCYLFAGLIFCFCKPRLMVAICVSLLVGYWAMMTFVPIREVPLEKGKLEELAAQRGVKMDAEKLFYSTTKTVTGHFEHGYNLANHLDFQYLPGRKYDTYFDPEGYLSTLPSIATCLLGVFAGLLLRNGKWSDHQKVIYLIMGGLIVLNLGWIWSVQFPVVKKIWTSSFVLVAGGYSAILLGIFYLVVDIWKYQKWCQPFVWMGMNSITIYLASNIIGGFRKLATRFVGGDVKDFFDGHLLKGSGDLIVAVFGLLLAFWFVHFLYRRKIFLRL